MSTVGNCWPAARGRIATFEVCGVELCCQLQGEVTDELAPVGDHGLVEVGCIARVEPAGLQMRRDRSQSFAHRLLAKLEHLTSSGAGQQPVLGPEVHIDSLEVTGGNHSVEVDHELLEQRADRFCALDRGGERLEALGSRSA